MKIGYLDCFSGISGDMLLGALVAAGLPAEILERLPADLGLSGCRVRVSHETLAGLAACRVRVETDPSRRHRHLAQISGILERGSLPQEVKERSLAVFHRLAEAEARVHGTTMERVHFHETGAVDALVDVVGTVSGLQRLDIGQLVCSPLPMPRGRVRCAHGELPLPAPAVCELLAGVPVHGEELDQELVTPTGAALVAELATAFGPLPPMVLEQTGYGAGSMERHDGRPNLLRLMVGTSFAAAERQEVEVIETHLDDWNPETWPYLAARFMELGALDVSLTPMQMKKGRPGFLLRLITDPAHASRLKETVFTETSAIGLRFHRMQRMTLPRRQVTVNTPWGPVQAKEIRTPAGPVLTPEYESCRRLAEARSIPLARIYREIGRGSGPQEEQQPLKPFQGSCRQQ